MPTINLQLESPVHESFRVQQVRGLFDLPTSETSSVHLQAELPTTDEPWQIGAIVGPSGSGKSSVARAAYGDAMVQHFHWPNDAAVVDGFEDALDCKAITGMLTSVGFSSVPAWVRPYSVLSTGQQFRCDLARALLQDAELVAFDEFTSVVDRQAACFGSAALAKAIRAGRARCKRFVAVSCHYDILDWLEPDWVLDMSSATLERRYVQPRSKKRPPIELNIRSSHKSIWPLFSSHHYLSSTLNPVTRCYIASIDDRPIAFCGTLPLIGHKGRRIAHRLVVLPDFQGMGIGRHMLNWVAQYEAAQNYGFSIVTSHPALIRALANEKHWRCTRVTRCGLAHTGLRKRTGRDIGSMGRATASFRWMGAPTNN